MSGTPLRNCVTPLGELIAHSARGLVYGNRGCLHDENGRSRRRYNGKRWIACRLRFRGRRRRRAPSCTTSASTRGHDHGATRKSRSPGFPTARSSSRRESPTSSSARTCCDGRLPATAILTAAAGSAGRRSHAAVARHGPRPAGSRSCPSFTLRRTKRGEQPRVQVAEELPRLLGARIERATGAGALTEVQDDGGQAASPLGG
jgi:hypothetical protein